MPGHKTARFRDYLKAFTGRWFVAMSGPLTVPAAALAGFVDNPYGRAALIVTAIACFIFSSFFIWKTEWERAEALQDKLAPKIKVVGLREHWGHTENEQVHELEVLNDSGTELSNCLAKVVDMKVTKLAYLGEERTEQQMDVSEIYRAKLPLALRTARNVERDGGGPFHLRAGESKKIVVCSRRNGPNEFLKIFFEPNSPAFMRELPNIFEAELVIELLGAPSTVRQRLKLHLNERYELKVDLLP